MNDKFTENHRDDIAQKLNRVVEQTHVNAQFAAELEEKLRKGNRSKAGWFVSSFQQISPTLRWAALMVLLALVLSWSIKSLIPAPQPAIDGTFTLPVRGTATTTPEATNLTATPVKQEGGYDFRGAKLFLQQPLPESPATARIYVLKKDQQATQEQARALAERFGIQGDIYTAPGYVSGTTDFVISDGKQSLQVHSNKYFTYTADMGKSHRAFPRPQNPDAGAIIAQFLGTHGFNFPFRVYVSEFFNGYIVQPLAPDSIPLQYESFTPPMMRFVLDENGQVLTIDASLMDYDQTPVGEYGIIGAQEAFDKLRDDYVTTGKIEFFHSPNNLPQEWYREYPDNQPITTYGYLSFNPALDPGKPALLLLDGVPVTGNTAGLENLEAYSFIKATGQYTVENGIRKLNVESWDRKINQAYFTGTLSKQGDQTVFTSDDGSGKQYPLIDPPVDVPVDTKIPESQLSVTGVIVDGKFFWTYIQYFANNGNGGGGGRGGGGLGFYKLNLSGAPVPFPSPTPRPATNSNNPTQFTGLYTVKEGDTLSMIAQTFGTTVDALRQLNGLNDEGLIMVGQTLVVPVPEAVEQKVEDLRGYLSISAHNKSDGTSSKEYHLDVPQDGGFRVYTMEGSMLGELDAYNGLPVLITGTVDTTGKLIVDRYKIPYPDLHFQILKGTQKAEQVDGQNVIVFTAEDGTSYVEYLATNTFPDDRSITGNQGDLIEQEVLLIPDEAFGGMPVAHVYQSSIVQDGGPPMEPQASRIPIYNEGNEPGLPGDLTPANLTIDTVELAYFVSNPYYQVNDPNYSLRSTYVQPVWHFHGRYTDGSEFDALIQALKQDFLLPELVPNAGVG